MKNFLQTLAKVICIILFSCSVSFAQVTFSVSPDSLDTTTGSNVCLDVTISGFTDIMTMQYSMNYNPAVLSFTGAQNFNLANFNSTNIGNSSAGDLTFSWLSDDVANGSSVTDGTSIYQLCFDVIGTSLTETTIEFSGSPTPIEIIEATGSLVNMIGENGIVTVDGGGIVPFLDFTVELDDVSVDAGNNICVPVQVHQFEQIAGAQFSINYDANVLSYTGSANLNLANLSTANIANPSAGMITFSWFTDDMSTGTTVNDGASIFDLCFDAIGNSGETSVLEVSSNPTPIEVFDVLGDFINVNEVDGSLTINNIAPVADFVIEITDFVADPCDDICVPVLVHEFTNIGGAQFSINYDPAILSYAEAINLNLANLAAANIGNPSLGEITFSWFTDDFTNGTSVANGTSIFEVCFDAIGNNGDLSVMDISGNPTTIEVFDNTGTLLNVVEDDGSIVVGVDNIAPEALCQDVTVVLDGNGVGSTTAELVDNGSNDACGIASLVLSQTAFDCNHVGIVNVVLTATDNDNNSATCNAEVLVVDNEAPVVACNDVTIQLDVTGEASITTVEIDNGSTDNCGIQSLALSQTDFDCSHVGTVAVVLTVTDNNDNVSTCDAVVTVEDNITPEALCQDVTVQLDVDGLGITTAELVDNGSNDACGLASLVLSQTDFDCSHVGTVAVVLTVTDNNDNVSTCDAVVTVEDNIAPEALCQDVNVQLDADGIGSTSAELVDNGSIDACGIASLVLSQTDFDCNHVGTLDLVLTVTDNNDNTSTCDAVVTVQDNIAPEALCQDVTVQLDVDGLGSTTSELVDNGSTDACGIASLVLSQTDFDCSHVGTVDVVLTVTDNNYNTSTCDAVVTVEDNIAPEALCQDVTVQLDVDGVGGTTAALVDNGSNDACGIASLVLSQTDFDCNHVGTVAVVLTVTDNNNITSTCDAVVTVEDNIAPEAICQDVTVELDEVGLGNTTAEAVDNGSTDACGIASLVLSQTNFDCTHVGTVAVVLTVTDNNDNTSTCDAVVTVEDNIAPEALCQDVTVELGADGLGITTAELVDNGSNDACGIASLVLSQTDFDCSHVGTVDVVLTVTDNNDNISTCDAVVTVEDNVAPEALCQDVTVELDVDGLGSTTAELVDNGSTDTCGIASLDLSQTDFDCAHVGTVAVVLTVTDNNNNVSTCDAVVTVQDNIAPEALCQDVTVELDVDGVGGTTAALVDNGSNDACGIASLVLSQTDFDCNHVGTVAVVLTVTDNNNITSTCDAVVTVEDNIAPEAICQDVTVELDEVGLGNTTAEAVDNGSNDACGIASLVLSQTDFDCSDVGEVTVTLTVTDMNANSATCNAIVTVEDNIAPEAICQDVTVELDENGVGFTSANLIDNGSNDACGIASLVLSQTDFDCSHVGEVTVTLTVTDVNTNSATCDAIVSVEDNLAPVMDCPSITINLAPGLCGQVVDYTVNVSDNCGVESLVLLDGVESGTYLDYHDSSWTANWEATDVNGNTSNCTVQIEMFEYANPSETLACNNNVEIALDEMGCTLIGADMILEGGPYGCYDDYIVSVGNGNAEVCCDAVGSTLSVTVTDPDTGNNCSGTISVVDHLAPTCVSIEDYTIACQDEIPSADDLDHVGYPVFEDNCAVETVLLVSETFINNDICVAPGIQLERKWLAVDVHGNTMDLADACTQIITIERTAITFPVDQEYDCSEYSLEDLNPDLTGSPFPASFETCMYTVSYSDQVFESCGGLKKIFRTWSVWDMCSDEFITIDANGTSNVQLISLIDTEAPQIDLEDMTLSTDVDQCAFTGFITLGSVTDNCTGVETVQLFIEGVSELEYVYNADGQVIGGFVPAPGIGLGEHTLKVVASDSCANASEVLVTVSIEDQITPTAICDELTQVALTSDGTATVFAETFDNGSYDNCCLEGFEVRRMEDTIFTETVVFDCEDLTANHLVVLRVNDCYGNSNTCMVEVLVEDKLFPYLTVPSNQEISCETYYTEIAAALETGDASVLDELFGTATFGDNCSAETTYAYTYNVDQCGVGSIIRTWTVTDGSGNGPISGTQTISIYHVSDWDVSFPGEITVNCTDGELPEIGEPIITGDNCEVIAVTYTDTQFDIVSGACYKIIREWSVINWCTYPQEPAVVGTQIINVEDTEAPIFDVEDFTVEILEADCDVEVTLPTPDVSDCSDDITITVESVLMDGEVGPGVYTANYTVNDGCGNYSYDEVLVTVVDAKDPTPYVTDELVTEIMASGETLVVEATDFDIASFDNCTDVSLSFSSDVNHIDTVFTCDNLGPNTLEIWVTDAYGNQDYAIVTLTVQDNLNTCNTNQLTVAGVLNTEAGEGIEGAMVEVNGGAYTQSSMTDGSFEFALPFGGDYTVAPILDTDVSNGVSTLDMVLINQHILGLNDLDSPYQMIAADANNSNSISTLDLVVIRMVILQMADAFPNNTSWRFVDADHVFVDPANPWDFPEVINYNDLEVNKLETDFIGVKIGDVNGSAQANFMSPAENRSGNSFELKTMDKQISAGDEVQVTLKSDARILGMQFTLEHNGLEYKGMEAGLLHEEHIASHESAVTFSWNEFELKDLSGEDLVTLIFEAKSAIQLSESLVITSSMTKAEGYTEQGIESVDLVFENNKSIANVLYQNVPNPFDGQTVVSFRLNKAGKAQILVTDVDGQLIQEIEGTYPQGLNSVELDRIQKAGVYYYQLNTEGYTATKKLVKI